MASNASAIMDYIATQLATIDGTGTYNNNVSASGKVVVGSGEVTQSNVMLDPMIFVTGFVVETVRGPNLNGWTRTMTASIMGFKATSADSSISRSKAAADLAADIDLALTGTSARRSGGGLFTDAFTQTAARDGNSIGFKGLGVCDMTVTFEYRGVL